jgi:hypothetical protein
VFISLYVNDRQSLVVLLAADGSINRLGTGAIDNRERDLLIGVTDPALFRSLAAQVDPAWFDYAGQQYTMPDQRGARCKLSLINGARPCALRLVASKISKTGVLMCTYVPAGDISLGTVGQT